MAARTSLLDALARRETPSADAGDAEPLPLSPDSTGGPTRGALI